MHYGFTVNNLKKGENMKIIIKSNVISNEEIKELVENLFKIEKEYPVESTLLVKKINLELLNQSENLSCDGAALGHPYEVQIPVKDLIDLYAVRAERENHQVGCRKR